MGDGEIDRVGSGLVLNFVPYPDKALMEMRRALVVGGEATAYVWDYADGMQMLRSFWDAATSIDYESASHDEGDRFPVCRPGGLGEAFEAAGFTGIRASEVWIPMFFTAFDDYWEPFLGGTGPASAYCLSLTDAGRERLAQRLTESLPVAPDGSISLQARAWVVTASSF